MHFTKKSEPPAPAPEPNVEQQAATLSTRLAEIDFQLRNLEGERSAVYVEWLNTVHRIADARTANAALAARTKSEVNNYGFRNKI